MTAASNLAFATGDAPSPAARLIVSTWRSTLAALLVGSCWSATGNAYSSYDLGNLECSVYLERRAQDQVAGSMESTSYIHAYLSGYLTAGNMMHGLIGDHAKDVSVNVHSVVQWLDAWCTAHKEQLVAVSLETFWVEAAAAKEQLRRNGGKLPALNPP